MQCLQCKHTNPSQEYCGACGAPLKLESFIGLQVEKQLHEKMKDRDLVERETSIKIFERVLG